MEKFKRLSNGTINKYDGQFLVPEPYGLVNDPFLQEYFTVTNDAINELQKDDPDYGYIADQIDYASDIVQLVGDDYDDFFYAHGGMIEDLWRILWFVYYQCDDQKWCMGVVYTPGCQQTRIHDWINDYKNIIDKRKEKENEK